MFGIQTQKISPIKDLIHQWKKAVLQVVFHNHKHSFLYKGNHKCKDILFLSIPNISTLKNKIKTFKKMGGGGGGGERDKQSLCHCDTTTLILNHNIIKH